MDARERERAREESHVRPTADLAAWLSVGPSLTSRRRRQEKEARGEIIAEAL